MTNLSYTKFNKALIIHDGTTKGFGYIQPINNFDKIGNKYLLHINTGIPHSILDAYQKKLYEDGHITDVHLHFLYNKSTRHKNVIRNIRGKDLRSAKSLANEIFNIKKGQ